MRTPEGEENATGVGSGEAPLLSEVRKKEARAGDAGISDAAPEPDAALQAEALRPARLPLDVERLLTARPEAAAPPVARPSDRPMPTEDAPQAGSLEISPRGARTVLLVLGGVLGLWLLVVVVLAILHVASR